MLRAAGWKELSPVEAERSEYLQNRAALMVELTEHIRRRGLTQKEAATTLGVTQPRISDLMRGRINVFSIDTLIAMLSRAGVKTMIRVGKRKVA